LIIDSVFVQETFISGSFILDILLTQELAPLIEAVEGIAMAKLNIEDL